MKQNDINQAVAKATGESVSEVSHRGFQLIDTSDTGPDDRELDQYLDWDAIESSRPLASVEPETAVIN